MEELWSKSDPEVWQAALDALDQRVAEHGKEGYAELDRCLDALGRSSQHCTVRIVAVFLVTRKAFR